MQSRMLFLYTTQSTDISPAYPSIGHSQRIFNLWIIFLCAILCCYFSLPSLVRCLVYSLPALFFPAFISTLPCNTFALYLTSLHFVQLVESRRRNTLEAVQRQREDRNTRELVEWEKRYYHHENEAKIRKHGDALGHLNVRTWTVGKMERACSRMFLNLFHAGMVGSTFG